MCVNSTIRPGDAVVVLGPGPIGLLCTRMAALSGANPLIVGGLTGDEARLEAARSLGATHAVNIQQENLGELVRSLSPLGADLVCDASGASDSLETALRLTRPDGQVIKVGWSPDVIPVDVNPLVLGNIRVQGSFSHNFGIWERVIHLLDTGVTMTATSCTENASLISKRSTSASFQPTLAATFRTASTGVIMTSFGSSPLVA